MLKCERCKRDFLKENDLNVHKSRIIPCSIPDNANSCDFCLKIFASASYKKKHELICIHKNDTRLLELDVGVDPTFPEHKMDCRFCNKKLIRTDALKEHVDVCKDREVYHEWLLGLKEVMISDNFPDSTVPFGEYRSFGILYKNRIMNLIKTIYNRNNPNETYKMALEFIAEFDKILIEKPENRNNIQYKNSSVCKIKTDTGYKYIDKHICYHVKVRECGCMLYGMKDQLDEEIFTYRKIVDIFEHLKMFSEKGSAYSEENII